jgi:hypothetical protein
LITPELAVHGEAEPVSNPGLPSSCAAVHPPLDGLIVHEKDVEPEAPVPSVAVTVTLEVPAVVGVPEITPLEELMLNPAGSPLAL